MPFTTSQYGTALCRSVSLSLTEVNENKEIWECVIYQNTEVEENESSVEKFDNAQIAIEYFINQVIKNKSKA